MIKISIPNAEEFFSMCEDKDYISLFIICTGITLLIFSVIVWTFDFICLNYTKIIFGISLIFLIIFSPIRGYRMHIIKNKMIALAEENEHRILISTKLRIINWMHSREGFYWDKPKVKEVGDFLNKCSKVRL